jgi:tetratricopeptide (TPR) repeat protein
MISRLTKAGLILLIIAGCGSQAQPTSTIVLKPTVTPFPVSQPTATVSATDTGEALRAANIEAGKQAFASNDYSLAIEHLSQAYAANRTDQAVGLLLAQAYQAHGLDLLEHQARTVDVLREAFDVFNNGLEIIPETDALHTALAADQQATQAAIEAQLALERYAASEDAALDVRQREAEAAFAALEVVMQLRPDFPQLNSLRSDILVALSRVRELASRDVSGDERKRLLLEAKDLCAQASELWPDDAEAAAPANECLERVEARLNPPKATAVPTSKPQPTAKPNTGTTDQRLAFGGYIQTGFPQGPNSNQFSSCINGRVLRSDGSAVAAASGNVNNGGAAVNWTTNGDGVFSACGLGFSNWGVTLYYVPGPGLRSEAVIYGVWLDGSAGQQAFVVFKAK